MPAPSTDSLPSKVVLVCATAVTMGLLSGTLYSFPVLSLPMATEFGWSRGATGMAFSTRLLVGAAGQALLGRLIDRLGPRRMGAVGIGATGVALVLISRITALWHLYLLFGGLAALGSSLLELSMLTTLTENFTGRRGAAMGITFGGGGLGVFVFLPLTQALVSEAGWRVAYGVLGLIMGCLIPLVAVTFRSGLGDPSTSEDAESPSIRWRGLATPTFRLLLLGNIMIGIFNEAVYQHAIPHATHLGYPGMAAASALGLASVLYVAGQILGGSLSDRVGRETTTTGASVLVVVGLLLLLGLPGPAAPELQIGMAVYGLGLGATLAARTASWGDIYKGNRFAATVGVIWSAYAIGGAFIAWFGGWVFDVSRSYVPAFIVAIGATVLWCATLWNVAPRRFR